jgi:hypothetical protein
VLTRKQKAENDFAGKFKPLTFALPNKKTGNSSLDRVRIHSSNKAVRSSRKRVLYKSNNTIYIQ